MSRVRSAFSRVLPSVAANFDRAPGLSHPEVKLIEHAEKMKRMPISIAKVAKRTYCHIAHFRKPMIPLQSYGNKA